MSTVVLIGCGGFGACWSRALDSLAGESVVGLVDPDATALAQAGERFAVAPHHRASSITGLPRDLEFDYAIDSSPFVHHLPNAVEVFARGADLVVAKPMAATHAEGTRIVAAAAAAGRELIVAHQMRYFECFARLRELLREQRLGPIRHVRVQMALDGRGWEPGTVWRLQLDHPLLLEAAIHHLDLLAWVLDVEISAVSARGWRTRRSPFRGTDSVTALLDTTAGFTIDYTASFGPDPLNPVRFDSGWTVEGDLGRAVVDQGGLRRYGTDNVAHTHLGPSPAPTDLDVLNTALLTDWRTTNSDAVCRGTDNLASLGVLDRLRDTIDRHSARVVRV